VKNACSPNGFRVRNKVHETDISFTKLNDVNTARSQTDTK